MTSQSVSQSGYKPLLCDQRAKNKTQYTFINKNSGYCESEPVLETTGNKLKALIYKHLYGCLLDYIKKQVNVARRIFIFTQSHAGRL